MGICDVSVAIYFALFKIYKMRFQIKSLFFWASLILLLTLVDNSLSAGKKGPCKSFAAMGGRKKRNSDNGAVS